MAALSPAARQTKTIEEGRGGEGRTWVYGCDIVSGIYAVFVIKSGHLVVRTLGAKALLSGNDGYGESQDYSGFFNTRSRLNQKCCAPFRSSSLFPLLARFLSRILDRFLFFLVERSSRCFTRRLDKFGYSKLET